MINTGPSGMGGFGNGQVGSARMAYGETPGPQPGYGGPQRTFGMPSRSNRMGPVKMPMGMPGMTPPINGPMSGPSMMPPQGGGINTGPSPNMMPNLGNDMVMNPPPPPQGMGISGPMKSPIMGPGGQSMFGQYGQQNPNRRFSF